MFSRALKVFVVAIGVIVAIVTILRYTQGGFRLDQWRRNGELASSVVTQDSLLIFQNVKKSDFISDEIPDPGDFIVTLNQRPGTLNTLLEEITKNPAGTEMEMTYRNASGDTISSRIRTIKPRPELVGFISILYVLRLLISAAFLFTGFWAFSKQPSSGAVRSLALFCFAMGALVVSVFKFGYEEIDVFTIPGFDRFMEYFQTLILFIGAFWLNLQLLFPRPKRFITRHPVLAYCLIYLPIALPVIGSIWIHNRMPGIIALVILLIQIVYGFVILIVYNIRTKDNLEKRQTRLVLWGTGSGIFGLLAVIGTIALFRRWFMSHSEYMIIAIFILVFIGLLLSPLSFIYAFGRYRLLEVEGRIKRGTRYFAITAVLVALFFVALYLLSGLLLHRIGDKSRAILPALSLALAVGFTPAHRKAQSILEKRIYPERARLKQMLRDFLAGALTVSDRRVFWSGLERRLCEVLKVDKVDTVLYAGAERPMITNEGVETPFLPSGQFVQALSRLESRPIMMDEVVASGAIPFSGDERSWLESNGIAMTLPLVSHKSIIGFLAIGLKSDREDFEPSDIEMLQSLASQAAMAGENLRLLEENLEKQRLEDELSMARKVQEGLLPRTMPETPGLEVAGRSLSCLEVAGDYFDVINLDENRTVLAIGDVSGKGAGAALLMSNLQASIRTAVRIGSNLQEIIGQINDLIFANTQANQFITFFAGIYDRSSSTFRYVNAGHNPPLLARADGGMLDLKRGGLILGAVAEMKYEQESVKLEPGDVIFLYTDGLSEAENPLGEMFDEERVKELVLRNFDLPVNELLDRVGEEVDSFTDGAPSKDDLTLLVARVKP